MKLTKFNAQHLRDFFIGGAQALKLNKSLVDALNVFPVPDGDTGSNMSATVSAAARTVQENQIDDIRVVAKELAHGALMGARGNSGVIFSQILRGMAQSFAFKTATPMALAKALQKGGDLAYHSVMKPVEGTILTVVREMAEAAIDSARDDGDCLQVLNAAFTAGEKTLAKTPEMLPALKQAGVVDAGGKGLLFVFQGGIAVLKGEEIFQDTEPTSGKVPETSEKSEYGYCTEFILRGNNLKAEKARTALSLLGDSLMVVGDKSTLKVHVHTLRPGAVLEYATLLGTLHDIKIDNMSEQHRENLQDMPKKPLAVVAVASGKGMEELFTSLSVDVIVPGGQSMNPSTEDLLNAVRLAHAEKIILLPNNKNIIPVAKQLTAVSEEQVSVLPTQNMLQGIAAMMVFDGVKSAAENIKHLSASYQNVTSIEITYAVRDTVVNGMEIAKDDILAVTDGVITHKGDTPESVLLECLKKEVTSDHEILTIFYGEEVFLEKVQELEKVIKEGFSDLKVETHYGGQPIYYYMASLE